MLGERQEQSAAASSLSSQKAKARDEAKSTSPSMDTRSINEARKAGVCPHANQHRVRHRQHDGAPTGVRPEQRANARPAGTQTREG